MPKLSSSALKARISQLQKQLAAAEANKAPAIKKVRALMKKLGVTIQDLQENAGASPRGRPAKPTLNNQASNGNGRKPRRSRGTVPIKYRDDAGNTWTGRGKTPRWITEAEKTGKTRDAFRIA
jgi:DNA-binding protein H-NS